jgi:hypothetical protein
MTTSEKPDIVQVPRHVLEKLLTRVEELLELVEGKGSGTDHRWRAQS